MSRNKKSYNKYRKVNQIEILNKKFNDLTPISLAYNDKNNVPFYNCQCSCGRMRIVKVYSIISGHVKNCAFHKRKFNVGDKVGRLTVLSHERGGYKCSCTCGKIRIFKELKNRKSCGCLIRELKVNLEGQRFGKLIAGQYRRMDDGHKEWFCKCDCGNEKWILGTNLNRGFSKSCGKCKR